MLLLHKGQTSPTVTGHAVRLPERQVCAEINLAPSYILLTFHLRASVHCIQETEMKSLAVCVDDYHLLPHNRNTTCL